MSEEERLQHEAVIAIIGACAAFPVAISLTALADALGGLIASSAKDRQTANMLTRIIHRQIKEVVADRLSGGF